MSWQMIVLPLTMTIDPQVVEIGDMAKAVYARENEPKGFAMIHATRPGANGDERDDKIIIYLSPVAAKLCTEIAEKYTVEDCDVPARNEPNIAWVFGDPLVRGELQESYEAKLAAQAQKQAESAGTTA